MSHAQATLPAGRCECGHYAPVGEITHCGRCDCNRHTAAAPSPYRGHDPDTPPGAEAALQAFMDALTDAREVLAQAIDAEVEAQIVYETAEDAWTLSPECPQVRRDEWTVAQRDAWVRSRVRDERAALLKAQAARKEASMFVRVLGQQLSGSQTRAKSVTASYLGTGRESW